MYDEIYEVARDRQEEIKAKWEKSLEETKAEYARKDRQSRKRAFSI